MPAQPAWGRAGAPARPVRRGGSLALGRLVEAGGERVPAESGALDAHGELHHAPQRFQIAQTQRTAVRAGGLAGPGAVERFAAVAADRLLVNGHHGLERSGEISDLVH
ncbi:type IV toxin-antitoxin system AbiEi family antitoxin [Candidatus Poriferisodalis sp.]|uniref:type IV toxin-antitoxin system AbiEi family antitoxin n=1 Tax=Candidatus Poriferisodalis sp. TaxID=3101277 RepID=UPI003B024C1D